MTKTAAEDIANIRSRLDEAFNDGNRATRRASKKLLEKFTSNEMLKLLLEDAGVTSPADLPKDKLSLEETRERVKSGTSKVSSILQKILNAASTAGKSVKWVIGQLFQGFMIAFGGLLTGSVLAVSSDLIGKIAIFGLNVSIGAMTLTIKGILALLGSVLGAPLATVIGLVAAAYLAFYITKFVLFVLVVLAKAYINAALWTTELTNNAISRIRKFFGESDDDVVLKAKHLERMPL
jgi:hypothetical protein